MEEKQSVDTETGKNKKTMRTADSLQLQIKADGLIYSQLAAAL